MVAGLSPSCWLEIFPFPLFPGKEYIALAKDVFQTGKLFSNCVRLCSDDVTCWLLVGRQLRCTETYLIRIHLSSEPADTLKMNELCNSPVGRTITKGG